MMVMLHMLVKPIEAKLTAAMSHMPPESQANAKEVPLPYINGISTSERSERGEMPRNEHFEERAQRATRNASPLIQYSPVFNSQNVVWVPEAGWTRARLDAQSTSKPSSFSVNLGAGSTLRRARTPLSQHVGRASPSSAAATSERSLDRLRLHTRADGVEPRAFG